MGGKGSGRRRKPSHLKMLDGSDKTHPERMNADEPPAIAGDPVFPAWAGNLPHGRQGWDEMTSTLRGMGMLSASYQSVLEAWVTAYNGFRLSLAKQEATGVVLESIDDQGRIVIKRNQATTEVHNYSDRMLKILSELGLTPSAKARVGRVNHAENAGSVLSFLQSTKRSG